MMREMEAAATDALQQGSIDMPRVRWNPYIITGLYAALYCVTQTVYFLVVK